MKRIILALIVLGTAGGVFLAAHQSTRRVQREARAGRETWIAQTQMVTLAQSERVELAGRVHELKKTLARSQSAGENALWSALRTNHARHLTPELRERLLEELGFNWQSSEEFIVVSKETLRDISMPAVRCGELSDIAATILAMTPEERGKVEAAIQRGQTEFKDWASSHTERSEPKDDVVAQYTLPSDPVGSQSMSNAFVAGIYVALGRERAELFVGYAQSWMSDVQMTSSEPTTMTVKRYMAGNELRLRVQLRQAGGMSSGDVSSHSFPVSFRPLFPNGWPDVALREGFELPKDFQK